MKFRNLFVFVLVGLFVSPIAGGQYFEFTGTSSTASHQYGGFQQGCNETYDIYFDTEGVAGITTAQTLVQFDNTRIYHVTGSNETYLRSYLFDVYKLNPAGMVSDIPGFPQWQSNYDKIKIAGQNTDVNAVSGYRRFGSLKFKPKFNYTTANFVFIYGGSDDTVLNDENGDKINPVHQNAHLTGSISIEKKPCFMDTDIPDVVINTPGPGYPTNYVSFVNGLDINLTDIGGTNPPYVRTGGSLWTSNSRSITNQHGIDSSTLSVSVLGTGSDGNLHNISLDNNDFNWSPLNLKTWEFEDRDYNISTGSSALFDFGVENEIHINISVDDRAGNSSSFAEYKFNTPVPPVISDADPDNGDIYVKLNSDINFKINDDWAGVDTGSVVVTLSGVSQSTSGYRYVFSGSDLSFVNNHGAALLGNSGGYNVTLATHDAFPTSGNIMVLVSGADLKGLYSTSNWTFTTRPSCDEMACCDPIVLKGENASGIWSGLYLNDEIYISGGNNAYLDWNGLDYTGYIQCNTTGLGLSIYSGHGDNFPNVDFVAFQELNGLYFSGKNVKAVLTGVNGDTIMLYRFGDFEVKVYPQNRSSYTVANNAGFNNSGKVLFYTSGNRGTPVASGYVGTNYDGTGEYILDIPSGYYDVVYKGWQQLSSYISGIYITGGQDVLLDFTTGVNLYGVYEGGLPYMGGSGYQFAGDLTTPSHHQDNVILVADLSILYGSACGYGVSANYTLKCDVNHDGVVDSSDASIIIENIGEKDAAYTLAIPLFGGFGISNY